MAPIKIKFWGVRGSIPTPGPRTTRYGGNTSCLEISFPNKPLMIVDAGSGIRELGKDLRNRQQPVHAYIFLSHFHWDHIQGLPFFQPAFESQNKFVIYGCDEPNVDLTKIISMQMNPIYFPVAIEDMSANVEFRTITEEHLTVEGVEIQTKFLNHPGYTLGFRFMHRGKSIVYMSDNEPFYRKQNQHSDNNDDSLESRFENYVEDKENQLVRFLAGADVFIHDAQYFPEEYQERISWGHSPYTYAVDLAVKGRVKQLVLFHHDPDHDDDTVDRILEFSRNQLQQQGYFIECLAAAEGDVIHL